MKRVGGYLVLVLVLAVGIGCIVFGVQFMTKATDGQTTVATNKAALVTKLATSNLTVDKLGETSDTLDTAIKSLSASAATSATAAAKVQVLTLQKTNIDLARTNSGMLELSSSILDLTKGLGTLFIVIGIGFVLISAIVWVVFGGVIKLDNGLAQQSKRG